MSRFLLREWQNINWGEALPPGEVHLFCLHVHDPRPADARILSPSEQQRAERFKVAPPRELFITGRILLRWLFQQYLQDRTTTIPLEFIGSGKPVLTGNHQWLQFNVAHSEELVVLALYRDGPVGIDLEYCRPLADRDGLVQRFFAPAEVDRFQQLPEAEKNRAFFRAWTSKEAILKAKALGISQLDAYAMNFEPDRPVGFAEAPLEDQGKWDWFEWRPRPQYWSTVVVQL